MRRAFKYGVLVLGGILLPLILVECVLQVAAFINVRAARMEDDGPTTEHERTVLCIGDSFTFGVGASARKYSYPEGIERGMDLVRISSLPWRVVNRGWPGLNSSELLMRTQGLLDETAPDYVCILIGRNNRWNRAQMDRPCEGRVDEWEWKVRTFRFFEILWANLADSDDAPAKGGPPMFQEADRLLRAGELDAARGCIDALRPRIRASDNPAAAVQFTELLFRLHDDEAIVDECLFHIEKHGPLAPFCYMLIKPLGRLERYEEALHWADEALRHLENGKNPVAILRARSWIHLLQEHPLPALKDLLDAYVLHGNDGFLEEDLLNVAHHSRKSLLALPEVLKAMSCDEDLAKRVQEVAYAVLTGRERAPGESEFHRRLREDLERIIALVKAHGAKPVLLTYPEPVREVDDCLRAVATMEGVPLVDLVPVFKRVVNPENRNKYFIADGHCTDEGYRIMGFHVAGVLDSLESP